MTVDVDARDSRLGDNRRTVRTLYCADECENVHAHCIGEGGKNVHEGRSGRLPPVAVDPVGALGFEVLPERVEELGGLLVRRVRRRAVHAVPPFPLAGHESAVRLQLGEIGAGRWLAKADHVGDAPHRQPLCLGGGHDAPQDVKPLRIVQLLADLPELSCLHSISLRADILPNPYTYCNMCTDAGRVCDGRGTEEEGAELLDAGSGAGGLVFVYTGDFAAVALHGEDPAVVFAGEAEGGKVGIGLLFIHS